MHEIGRMLSKFIAYMALPRCLGQFEFIDFQPQAGFKTAWRPFLDPFLQVKGPVQRFSIGSCFENWHRAVSLHRGSGLEKKASKWMFIIILGDFPGSGLSHVKAVPAKKGSERDFVGPCLFIVKAVWKTKESKCMLITILVDFPRPCLSHLKAVPAK